LRSTSSPSETRKSLELIFIFILSEALPAHRDVPSSEPDLNRHNPDSGADEGHRLACGLPARQASPMTDAPGRTVCLEALELIALPSSTQAEPRS
jgi:hypothetical protein